MHVCAAPSQPRWAQRHGGDCASAYLCMHSQTVRVACRRGTCRTRGGGRRRTCIVFSWLSESLAKQARMRFTVTRTSTLPPAGTMPRFGKTESHGGSTQPGAPAGASAPEGSGEARKRKAPSPWPLLESVSLAESLWTERVALGSRMSGTCVQGGTCGAHHTALEQHRGRGGGVGCCGGNDDTVMSHAAPVFLLRVTVPCMRCHACDILHAVASVYWL